MKGIEKNVYVSKKFLNFYVCVDGKQSHESDTF